MRPFGFGDTKPKSPRAEQPRPTKETKINKHRSAETTFYTPMKISIFVCIQLVTKIGL